jgi:hypothetical protein
MLVKRDEDEKEVIIVHLLILDLKLMIGGSGSVCIATKVGLTNIFVMLMIFCYHLDWRPFWLA